MEHLHSPTELQAVPSLHFLRNILKVVAMNVAALRQKRHFGIADKNRSGGIWIDEVVGRICFSVERHLAVKEPAANFIAESRRRQPAMSGGFLNSEVPSTTFSNEIRGGFFNSEVPLKN